MRYGTVVIGSGPGGVAAARAYVQAGGAGTVCLLTLDETEPYLRPPLSKEVLAGDEPCEPTPIGDDLADLGVEVRLRTPVVELEVQDGVAQTDHGPVEFDTCVIATGASPVPLPGAADDADVHVLRSFADARELVGAAGDASSALVVGSGFIGCEAAASLARRGLDVTLATPEEGPQLARLGEFASGRIAGWLRDLGVTLKLGVDVEEVAAPRRVRLGDGTTLEPDLVLAAVGVRPNVEVFEAAGLTVDEGRIVADERLETDVPGIYVAGDVAFAHHAVADRRLVVEHWDDAETMGGIAGRNAAGAEEAWDAAPGFWSTIGEHTLMYSAWGDGYDDLVVDDRGDDFVVRYGRGGTLVGVLAHGATEDYERGTDEMLEGAPLRGA